MITFFETMPILSTSSVPSSGGTVIKNQDKTVTTNGKVVADSGYTGLGTVTVNVTPKLQEKTVTQNSTVTPDPDYDGLSSVEVNVVPNLQAKEATTNGQVLPDQGYDGLSSVNVQVDLDLQAKEATSNGTVTPDEGYNGLSSVEVNVQPNLQEKTTTVNGTITPDAEYDGLSSVIVNVALNLQEKTFNSNGKFGPEEPYTGFSSVTVDVKPNLQEKEAVANGPIVADEGYDGLSTVNVNVQPNLQSKTVTSNGTVNPDPEYDGLSSVEVNVQPALQTKTVTTNGTVTPDASYYGLSSVVVNVPSSQPTNFEAINGLGRIPEVGEKVFAQPVNQSTEFYSQFDVSNVVASSYYPNFLLNTVAIRGLYPTRYVYSFDKDSGSTIAYEVKTNDAFIRYLSNNRCYMVDNSYDSSLIILKENDYSTLTLSTSYSGIISDSYVYDAKSGVLKIYSLTNDAVGDEVAAFPSTYTNNIYVLGLHNSNVFYILVNGNKLIPYEIDSDSKICKQLGDGTTVSGVRGLAGITLDNKYLVCFGSSTGSIYKIADDYTLEIDARITLDGNISFNPYNGILCTSHANDNTLSPSLFKYENGDWTQLQFDTSGTSQSKFSNSAPTVNSDCSYLLSRSASYSWLYKLAKTEGGYKAVECIRNNFTTEGITATVVSGDESTLTLTPTLPI